MGFLFTLLFHSGFQWALGALLVALWRLSLSEREVAERKMPSVERSGRRVARLADTASTADPPKILRKVSARCGLHTASL